MNEKAPETDLRADREMLDEADSDAYALDDLDAVGHGVEVLERRGVRLELFSADCVRETRGELDALPQLVELALRDSESE